MEDNKLTGVCWLQVQADYDDDANIVGAKIVKSTQRPPVVTSPNVRVVKLELSVPLDTFDSLEAEVDVPAELVETPQIDGDKNNK